MNIIEGVCCPDLKVLPVMGLVRHSHSNLFLPGDRMAAKVVSSNTFISMPLMCMFSKVEPKLLLRAVIHRVRIVVITFFRHAPVRC